MSLTPDQEAVELDRISGQVDQGEQLTISDASFLLGIIEEQAAVIRRIKNEYQTIIEYGVQPWDKP